MVPPPSPNMNSSTPSPPLAFIVPFLAPQRSLLESRQSLCVARRRVAHRRVIASSSSGHPPADGPSVGHDSWRVYCKPGNLCVVCSGKGVTNCLYCYGEGTIRIGPETGRDSLSCPQCEGSGLETCARCEGTGIRPATRFDLDTMKLEPNLTNEQVSQLELPKDSRDTGTDSSQSDIEPSPDKSEVAANGVPS